MADDTTTFSARLRAATRTDHTAAEISPFIVTLLEGSRTLYEYTLLIAQYHPIYAALEGAAAGLRQDSELVEILDPRLDRLASIDADLTLLLPMAGLDDRPPPLPATVTYVSAIEDAAADPARFLAHHYLRYLGDLSGGQAIGALAHRHYDVPTQALSMWRFEGIEKHKTYKDDYRARLDIFADTDDRAETMVAEAVAGFGLNRRLFAELLDQTTALPAAG